GAQPRVGAGHRGRYVDLGGAPRHGVLLDAARRDPEGVDHVPRVESEAHAGAYRDVQLLRDDAGRGVHEAPLPLLALDLHLEFGGLRTADVDQPHRAVPEETDHEQEADDQPDGLERSMLVDRRGGAPLPPRPATGGRINTPPDPETAT